MDVATKVKIENYKERLKNLSDISLLVARLRGPCEYNPAAFCAEEMVCSPCSFWRQKDKTRPTIEELERENVLLLAEQEAAKSLEYQSLRQVEYPSMLECIEALFENMEGNPEKLEQVLAQREAVRLKYPKQS